MRDATAELLHVSAANLLRWALQGIGEIDQIDHLDKILRSKKKAALTGPVSQSKAIEDALLHNIFKLHEQGITVAFITHAPHHHQRRRSLPPPSILQPFCH
jgi:hypothetical protein